MQAIVKRAFHFTDDVVETNPATGELQRRVVREHRCKASTQPQYVPDWIKTTELYKMVMAERKKPIIVLSTEELQAVAV